MDLKTVTSRTVSAGSSMPLGATLDSEGCNFAVFSRHAEAVFVDLFDPSGEQLTDRIELSRDSGDVFSARVSGVGQSQLYGIRALGEYHPRAGRYFNPYKLLIDPYARALTDIHHNRKGLLFGYAEGNLDEPDKRDSATVAPKCIVTAADGYDWQDDRRPDIPLQDLVIYETHVRGFTIHESSGVSLPGTFSGFIEKIPYLKSLGINAVELLPVQQFYSREELERNGLREYWGYNTIAFFAPHVRYGSGAGPGCAVNEFKDMVRALHAAGIEVFLDVVYNHTGEGGRLGPTVCFRGLDNETYYLRSRTGGEDFEYLDLTGTDNTLNAGDPAVLALIIDSLTFWAEEMHVDGFRFDLAPVLASQGGKFAADSPFFSAVARRPVLRERKLIAEPWDLKSYQLGNFPEGWSEWNGGYRDTVRAFLAGKPGQAEALGYRLTGSSDLYRKKGRYPWNSINFVTCHDGSTLIDLYSYTGKHNEANLEDNRDGADEAGKMNFGVEGATQSEEILNERKRMAKNALAILMLSLGTPMILGGDEMLRTQRGNNNAYCQDNGLSWYDWRLLEKNADMFRFLRELISLRSGHPVIRRILFFNGTDGDADQMLDIEWFNEDLGPLDWQNRSVRLLAYQIDGSEVAGNGDYTLFVVINMYRVSKKIRLPVHPGMTWIRLVDTNLAPGEDIRDESSAPVVDPQEYYWCNATSVVVLKGNYAQRTR
ncbi:MAG: glycogen debranching protein GlgX [Spirochaetales bacterium]|nr:glycogen debranching protein GlgX [Spirochaetales bacterium]